MSLHRKITYASFLLALVVVLLAAGAVYSANQIEIYVLKLKLESDKQTAIAEFRSSVSRLIMAPNDFIITRSPHYREEYFRLFNFVQYNYYRLNNLSMDSFEKSQLSAISDQLDSVDRMSSNIFSLTNGSPAVLISEMEKLDYLYAENVNMVTRRMIDSTNIRLQMYHSKIAALRENIIFSVYLTVPIFIACIILFILFTKYFITKPISLISQAAKLAVSQNFSPLPVSGKNDELALLSASFNKMIETIKLSEREQQAGKKLIETILETVPLGLLVFEESGRIIHYNEGFSKLFDVPPGYFLQKNIEDVLELVSAPEPCRQKIISRQTITASECVYNNPVRGPRVIQITVRQVTYFNNACLLILNDITDQKKNELLIADNERYFRALAENSATGLMITDISGTITYESPINKTLTGYAKSELNPNSIYSLVHPDDQEQLTSAFRSIAEQPLSAFNLELRIRQKSGTWCWIAIMAKNTLQDSVIGGIIIAFQDITLRKRMEEQNKLILTAIDQNADSVVITDMNGYIQYVNPSFYKIYEFEPGEVIGKTPAILKSGHHSPEFFKQLWTTVQTGGVFSGLFINKSASGKLIYINQTITPVKDNKGRITNFVSTAKEFTEQYLMEMRLRENESHTLMILENINEIVYSTSFTGIKNADTADFVSSKSTDIMGYTPEEFKHNSSLWLQVIHPDDRQRVIEQTSRIFKDGIPVTRSFRVLHKNTGKYIWLEDTIVPKRNQAGEFTGSFGVARDVTERVIRDSEILSERNKFTQLFDNSPVAIVLVDGLAKITHVNAAFTALFGFTIDEITGKNIDDVIIPDEYREEASSVSQNLLNGVQVDKETIRKRKDGSLVYVQVLGVPVLANDQIIGVFGLYVDLTRSKEEAKELLRLKEIAERSSKLKDSFIANMSHEIRTPVNGILGMTSIIKDMFEEQVSEEDKFLFQGIENASTRLVRTIEMILNYSRLEVGEYPMFKKDINLETICSKLVTEHRMAAAKKGLSLSYTNTCGDIILHADEYSITQSIANLIDNAIKYTNAGFVHLALNRQADRQVILTVSDSGIGISQAYISEIFEPYRQEETGYGRAYEGVGLGLPLIKKFMVLNNFDIGVTSEKGKGTVFTIYFGKPASLV